MNKIALNTVPLDGGVIIKKGSGGGGGVTINNQSKIVDITENGTTEIVADTGYTGLGKVTINTNVASSGGGTELEGEYYLAKPNGRYWKSKLAKMEREKYPTVSNLKSNFTEAQLESLAVCAETFGFCAFSAIGGYGGIPTSGYEVLFQIPIITTRCSQDSDSIRTDEHIILLGAWQECDFTMLMPGTSMYCNGLVGFMRLMAGGELDGMSDDEVLAMASEMLMIEQVTREEYESWYNW